MHVRIQPPVNPLILPYCPHTLHVHVWVCCCGTGLAVACGWLVLGHRPDWPGLEEGPARLQVQAAAAVSWLV